MKLKDIFATASANMFRSKLRTLLTITAIFIGAFTLTLTNGIGTGVSDYMDKQVGTLGQKDAITIQIKNPQMGNVGAEEPVKYDPNLTNSSTRFPGPGGSGSALTEKDLTKLKAIDSITDVKAVRSINTDYIQGVNGEKYKLSISPVLGSVNLDLAAGRQINKSTADNQIILPLGFVAALGYESSQQAIDKPVVIGISDAFGKQQVVNATIIGVQQVGLISSTGAAINQTLSDNLYNIQTNGLPDATKNKFAAVTARIVGSLEASHVTEIKQSLDKLGYTAQTPDDLLGVFKTVVSAITAVLNGFAAIALLAASFGIVNTLLMSVQERTKEIGLMKAMGMRSSRIFLLFSSEAVLIGFWGSAIGATIAIIVGNLINGVLAEGLLKELPGLNLFAFGPQSIVGIILLIMLIAFLAGTLPARKAANQNPIDALRYE